MRSSIQKVIGDFAAIADYCHELTERDLEVELDNLPDAAHRAMARQLNEAYPMPA